eukprot:SAG31_NODE_14927_length_780_cov_1.135095_1_plen_185_part_10
MRAGGTPLTAGELREIFVFVDRDGDGAVSFDEFRNFLQPNDVPVVAGRAASPTPTGRKKSKKQAKTSTGIATAAHANERLDPPPIPGTLTPDETEMIWHCAQWYEAMPLYSLTLLDLADVMCGFRCLGCVGWPNMASHLSRSSGPKMKGNLAGSFSMETIQLHLHTTGAGWSMSCHSVRKFEAAE